MSKLSVQHVEQVRMNLAAIKWVTIIALLILPFSFSDGVADWRYLAVAPVCGLLWIACSIYSWRHESPLAAGISYLVFVGAYRFSDSLHATDAPFGHFIQWMSAMLIVATFPVIAFRSRLLNYCGLQNLDSTTRRSTTTT